MKVGYVVLYVDDADACLRFWTEKIGMIEKGSKQAGPFSIAQVGFADQEFGFELVPLELMKNNPAGLDLGTPSLAFHVEDLGAAHAAFVADGVQVTEPGEHSGVSSFAFADPEGKWFAVLEG